MDADVFFIHAMTPLHPGTGQGIGVIDQPVARESATGVPFLPGSSIKGVFRSECERGDLAQRVYGADAQSRETFAGSLQFTDARVLFLPVRSLNGLFAWVTAPFMLQRFLRDTLLSGSEKLEAVPDLDNEECFVASSTSQIVNQANDERFVVLEDVQLKAQESPELSQWRKHLRKVLFPGDENGQNSFEDRLCVVSDDVFSFFLETATEVNAHIQLEEETKTTRQGALWYEETLPPESILYGLAIYSPLKATRQEVEDVLQDTIQSPLQFGGNATVGQGLCWVRLGEREGA